MKKGYLFSAFILLSSVLLLTSCGDNGCSGCRGGRCPHKEKQDNRKSKKRGRSYSSTRTEKLTPYSERDYQ